MSNTPPPSAAPEPAAAAAAADALVRANARMAVLEYVAEHGVGGLSGLCWGYARGALRSGDPADLIVAVVESLRDADDEVRAVFETSGLNGVRAALEVERAAAGGAS